MDRDIAEQAVRYCSVQQAREYRLWNEARDPKQAEIHRVRCGDWATIAQSIYRQWLRPEPAKENIHEH